MGALAYNSCAARAAMAGPNGFPTGVGLLALPPNVHTNQKIQTARLKDACKQRTWNNVEIGRKWR